MRRILLLLIPLTLTIAACGGGDDASHGDGFRFDPPRIEASVGEELAIELTAADVEHDFVIDELDAHVSAGRGETATGGFHAGEERGTYTYYCSVPGHRDAGMEGELVVG